MGPVEDHETLQEVVMATIEDYARTLKTVPAVRQRPQPKLTTTEIKQIADAARPFFEAYEAQIAALKESQPTNGPAWYGYANDGTEYQGEQKQEILHEWMEAVGAPDEKSLLRATLGERGDGPRSRGPVTFYTYPGAEGIAALWVAKSDNLTLLKSMVAPVIGNGDDEEE